MLFYKTRYPTVLAVAMAAVLSQPVQAQSQVVISGKINAAWEWVQAKGATHSGGDIKQKDRMVESGSEIRIYAKEDLGNGNQAFVDIQTAVDIFGSNDVATSDAGRLGSRRGAIGLRGKWGTIMLGKWDIYENTMSAAGTEGSAPNQSLHGRGILNMVGGKSYTQTGCRCDNTIRYVTPNFNGLEAAFSYTRNGKGSTSGEITWRPEDENRVDRTFSAQAAYKQGGWRLMAGLWMRQNAQGGIGVKDAKHDRWASEYAGKAGFGSGAQAVLKDELSYRAGIGYAFNMGLTVAFNIDYSEITHKFADSTQGHLNGNEIKLKRTAWTLPLSYKTGPHQFHLVYGQANDLSGWSDTGAKFWGAGYTYNLSKRTSLYAGYARFSNERYASYDLWSSGGIGMKAANVGADPTTMMVGITHSF